MSRFKFNTVSEENAKVLTELVTNEDTSPAKRIEILNKINEARENQGFFRTMWEELLSFGECPECGHKNHWAIPETDLNQMGWVSFKEDVRVKQSTDESDCKEFAEACNKKKITI